MLIQLGLGMLNLALSACNIVYFINGLGSEHYAISALSLFVAMFCGAVGLKILFDK